jgi:B9 domain-containing protein 2
MRLRRTRSSHSNLTLITRSSQDEDEENRDGNAERRDRRGKKGKGKKKDRSNRNTDGEEEDEEAEDEVGGGGGGVQNKEYMRRQPMEKLEARLRERVRVVAQMTPEVHFIGEIVGGSNFNGKGMSCKFTVEFGKNWDLLSGEIMGQTQYGNADPDDLTSWNHPIDLHMATSTMQGWPRIRLQVWELDEYGRTNMAGYGFCHLPTNAGNYEIGVPCWRPTGSIPEEIQSFFLGANTQLTDESVLYSKAWENRCRLVTVPSGKVWINVSVVHRFFAQQNVDLPTGNF